MAPKETKITPKAPNSGIKTQTATGFYKQRQS